ncbi:MAG TPA: hypothetical protein VMW35_14575 [Myxococcota bacterium]|jgi:hypothetical protein|nr:hypothetical protein [Myxococcota bacterium]
MATEKETLELSDVMLHLKEAFEDKDPDALRKLFRQNAKINIDARFYTVAEFVANARAIFEAVDQIYLDIVGLERVQPDPRAPFVSFGVDVAWVDKQTWQENSRNLVFGLDLLRDEKTNELGIHGMTVGDRPVQPGTTGAVPEFPKDVREPTDRGFDPFSVWY